MVEDLYTDFVCFMDSIFYDGYAEQLAKENPEEFTNEFTNYLDNYLKTDTL